MIMRLIIITVTVLALIGVALTPFTYLNRTYGYPTRDLSKMMSVRIITAEAVSDYYKEHGSYPDMLSELTLQTLRWGDGNSSPKGLESWHYSSGGQSFRMKWEGIRGLKLLLVGKSGQIYYEEDQKQ